MNCKQGTLEIVEKARHGAAPGDALSAHLAECPSCSDRWATEVQLSRSLRQVRAATSLLRSPDAARDRLLAAFDARGIARGPQPRWMWAAVAATVVLAMALAISKQPVAHRPANGEAQLEMPAEDLIADNEFVPVPYAPPLAQGEVVEIVRMDLSPAALARLGFVTQAGYSNEVTTDLAIGQDGLPRAVRVPESVEIRY